jgi:hypothetical protein
MQINDGIGYLFPCFVPVEALDGPGRLAEYVMDCLLNANFANLPNANLLFRLISRNLS